MMLRYKVTSQSEQLFLLIAGFVNAMSFCMPVYFSLYLNSLGMAGNTIGHILGLYGLSGAIGGYLGGHASVKYSPLVICRWSTFFSFIAYFFLPFNHTAWGLIGLLLVLGFMANLFRPAYILALTNNAQKSSLEKIIAIRRVVVNVGMATGAVVCGILAYKGYIAVFMCMAFISLTSWGLLYLASDQSHSRENQAITEEINSEASTNGLWLQNALILISLALVLLIFNQSQMVYPLYLSQMLAFNSIDISVVFFINGLLVALIQIPISAYLSRYSVKYVSLIGAFLVFFGFAMTGECQALTSVLTCCIIWTLGEIIFFPANLSWLMRLNISNRGRIVGVYQLVFSFALFYSPLMGMKFYHYGVNTIWYLSGFLCVFSLLALILVGFKKVG